MFTKRLAIVIIYVHDRKYFTVKVHPMITNGLALFFKLASIDRGHFLVWLILTEPESEMFLSLKLSSDRYW